MGRADKRTLLLLGGARHQVCAIECAKRLGYRTVLCDYLPDNPGQYVADVFYQESTTDRETVLRIARKEQVDGVLSFGTDVALPTAGYVAEQLGLPSNPLEAIEALSDKHRFRATLERLGLPCPGFVSFAADERPERVLERLSELSLPLIVKPTDSSGSKGVTILHQRSLEQLADAIEAAREYNRNDTLVVEEFLTQTFPRIIGGDIFVLDGTIVFWGLMGALRDERLGGLVPVGEAYPSGLTDELERRVRHDLQALVSGLGLRFGEMNVEVLVGPQGTPYIIELAGRAGGNMIPQQLSDLSGIDLVEASVRCAMGEPLDGVAFDKGERAIATYMLHPQMAGTFVGVECADELAAHVYRQEVFVEPGEHVDQLTNSSQNIGILFLECDDAHEMWELLGRMHELVRVVVA